MTLTSEEVRDALRIDGWDVERVNYIDHDATIAEVWFNHEVDSNYDASKRCVYMNFWSLWELKEALETYAERKLHKPKEVDEATGLKFDSDKPRPELIPPLAEEEVARVLAKGAEKYFPENWRLVPDAGGPRGRYLGAARRHILAYMQGDWYDPETDLHSLAHAIASLLFVLELELELE
jgi:hypothetical protein